MTKSKNSCVLLCFGLIISLSCCRKKDDQVSTPIDNSPKLQLVFKNEVDGKPLVLNTGQYLNANGDTFSVFEYKYYISNIELKEPTSGTVKEDESYHLISEKIPGSKSFSLKNIKEGTYVSIKFLIGVDSARNVSGAQSGALDVINGMFWDWNSGYIMAKIEGTSPQAGSIPNNLGFHIGGFSGTNSALRWVELTFPNPVKISSDSRTTVEITSNLAEWFKTPNKINFSQMSTINTPGYGAFMISSNYADMFSINRVY